jgi:hypothetical protein
VKSLSEVGARERLARIDLRETGTEGKASERDRALIVTKSRTAGVAAKVAAAEGE